MSRNKRSRLGGFGRAGLGVWLHLNNMNSYTVEAQGILVMSVIRLLMKEKEEEGGVSWEVCLQIFEFYKFHQ